MSENGCVFYLGKYGDIQAFVEDLTKICIKHNKKFGVQLLTINAYVKNDEDGFKVDEKGNLIGVDIKRDPKITEVTEYVEVDKGKFQSPTSSQRNSKEK